MLREHVAEDTLSFGELGVIERIGAVDTEVEFPLRACGDDLAVVEHAARACPVFWRMPTPARMRGTPVVVASANSHAERRRAPCLMSSETARGSGSKKRLAIATAAPLRPRPTSVGTPSTSAKGWSALVSPLRPDTEAPSPARVWP